MDSLPTLQEALAYVQNEESCHWVMLSSTPTDRSALVSIPLREGTKQFGSSPSDRPKVFCDYSNRPNHTRENYWTLHGHPPGGRGGRFGGHGDNARAHHTPVTDPTALGTNASVIPLM